MEQGNNSCFSKNVLFVAKVDSHILHFHLPYLEYFNRRGSSVYVASEGQSEIPFVDQKFNVKFGKNPLSFSTHILNLKEIMSIIDKYNIDLIHTNTAIASSLVSFAVRKKRKEGKNIRLIYTAHGYHFHRKSGILNWLLFFPVELMASKNIDDLILINKEDYQLAQKYMLANKIHLVRGVGVEKKLFSPLEKLGFESIEQLQRKRFDEKKIIYIAEFNENKNHQFLVSVFRKLYETDNKFKLILVGTGTKIDTIKNMVEDLGIGHSVQFLGYITNVEDVLQSCSICVSPSKREGLPVNIIESMMAGLPIVASNVRGHVDLVSNDKNGYLSDLNHDDFIKKILSIFSDIETYQRMSNSSFKISEQYSIDTVFEEYKKIYLNL